MPLCFFATTKPSPIHLTFAGSPTASPEASPSASPSKSPTDSPTTSPEASPSASPSVPDTDCAPDNPCLNDGVCVEEPGAGVYSCNCTGTGYEGTNCEINVNDCDPNPCQSGGICTDGINEFTCDCTDTGYEGPTCQVDVNECDTGTHDCDPNAECFNSDGSYSCTCFPGYEDADGTSGGKNCTEIDECSSNPCANGATCTDLINDYECACVDGYEGDNCETNIDDCSPNPCLNKATCVDGINNYTCSCADGYTGTLCEINIDECASDPCKNGGNCTDGVRSTTFVSEKPRRRSSTSMVTIAPRFTIVSITPRDLRPTVGVSGLYILTSTTRRHMNSVTTPSSQCRRLLRAVSEFERLERPIVVTRRSFQSSTQ